MKRNTFQTFYKMNQIHSRIKSFSSLASTIKRLIRVTSCSCSRSIISPKVSRNAVRDLDSSKSFSITTSNQMTKSRWWKFVGSMPVKGSILLLLEIFGSKLLRTSEIFLLLIAKSVWLKLCRLLAMIRTRTKAKIRKMRLSVHFWCSRFCKASQTWNSVSSKIICSIGLKYKIGSFERTTIKSKKTWKKSRKCAKK